MLIDILSPFKTLKFIANEEICKKFVSTAMDMFTQRIQILDDRDIKDANKCDINDFSYQMKQILNIIYTNDEALKIIQGHKLNLTLKFIQSPSFEKRLNGLLRPSGNNTALPAAVVG